MTETQKPPIGELVIVALRARDLPNREIVGKQDPFCVFRLGEVAQRTKTDYRGGQHPLWDDQVNIPVPPNKTKLYMQLFDEDSHREDLISEGELDLTKVLREGEQDDWFPLSYRGRKAGEIYLELTFYSARPPPKRQPTRYKQPARPPSARPPMPQQQQQARPPYNNNATRPPAPVPTESASTPARFSGVGPPPYIPPSQRPGSAQHDHLATPHMPPTITPSSSTGTASSAGGGGGGGGYPYRPHPQQQQQRPPPPSAQQGYPPQPGGYPPVSYPPHPATQGQPVQNGGTAPLLSAPFRPGSPPTYGGYPPASTPMGFHPPQPYPPQQHNAPYPPPATSGYPPVSNVNFPEPQTYASGYAPHSDPIGTPFAAHQGSYPPAVVPGGYPPPAPAAAAGGYPPPPHAGGYPPRPAYPPY